MKTRPGAIKKNMKNQPGTMKNQPGTMKNHENPWKPMKNQPGTMRNHEKPWKTNLEPWKTMKIDLGRAVINKKITHKQTDRTFLLYIDVAKLQISSSWRPGQRFTFHENRFSSMLTVVIGLATTLRAASSKIFWKQKTSTKGDTRTPQRSMISLWTSPA